ncbi:hypothetical protein [Salinimicrobium soli]|uniref:hypothetical protein n=1 Tax=Salinimicrobium soli TaxID=1254399 RepID=UPI003AAB42F5
MKLNHNSIKFLLLLLAFSSLGGNFSFGATAQIKQDHHHSSERIQGISNLFFAVPENLIRNFPDPAEDLSFGSLFLWQSFSFSAETVKKQATAFRYSRDLRAEISTQTFPTHYFL